MIDNKPSIYNAQSVYNQGVAKKSVTGGFPFIVDNNSSVAVTDESIKLLNLTATGSSSDSFYMGIMPIYGSDKKFNDLNIGDEIELNFVGKVTKRGSGRTHILKTTDYYTADGQFYADDCTFEINNYDGSSWFRACGNVSSYINFAYNTKVVINYYFKKTAVDTFKFVCTYNGTKYFDREFIIPESVLSRTCLLCFGSFNTTNGFKSGSEILPGSYIKINGELIFGSEE